MYIKLFILYAKIISICIIKQTKINSSSKIQSGAIVRHVWKFPLRLISIMNISHFKEKMNTFIKILGKMC